MSMDVQAHPRPDGASQGPVAGLAEECLVQLRYCIWLVDPVSVIVNTYGTGKRFDEALLKLVR